MDNDTILIGSGTLTRQSLAGQAAVVTGAGQGIGFEAARALAWLGAKVVVAEIDKKAGRAAEARLRTEMGVGAAVFIHTDVGDERSVRRMAQQAERLFGKIDIVINNATIAPFGAVRDCPIDKWDASYRVNLRGPVLLARAFLPAMLQRDYGVFVCVSSVGGAYMGPYETFKTAQVELARTLDGELEGTGVIAFTIGPGIVPTNAANTGVAYIAPLYGKTTEEFFEMYKDFLISIEAAGAGFAAAVALAPSFRGSETYSRAALAAAGIQIPEASPAGAGLSLSDEQRARALELCHEVRLTLAGQAEGWSQRTLFERAWMQRDFKQHAGLSAEDLLGRLTKMEQALESGDCSSLAGSCDILEKLAGYYQHYQDLTRSNIKDPQQVQELLKTMQGWQEDARELAVILGQ